MSYEILNYEKPEASNIADATTPDFSEGYQSVSQHQVETAGSLPLVRIEAGTLYFGPEDTSVDVTTQKPVEPVVVVAGTEQGHRDASTTSATEVDYPNGDSITVARDQNGTITSITNENGSSYKPIGTGRYEFQAALPVVEPGMYQERTTPPVVENIDPSHDHFINNPQIDANGNFSYSTDNGKHVTISPEGERTTLFFESGTIVTSNIDDQVTEIRYQNGTSSQFKYDSNWLVNEVTANGETYKRMPNGTFIDSSGKDSGYSNFSANLFNGTFSFLRDGTRIHVQTDGSIIPGAGTTTIVSQNNSHSSTQSSQLRRQTTQTVAPVVPRELEEEPYRTSGPR